MNPTTLVNPFTATVEDANLGPVATPTILTWDPSTPTALHFQFHPVTQNEGVTWAIGRQLVIDAMATPGVEVGDGDIAVSATNLHLMMCLRGVDTVTGEWSIGALRMPVSAVRWVVANSVAMIPPGSEAEAAVLAGDLDAELELILGDAA